MKVKVLPCPVLAAVIRPPWALMTAMARLRPSPVPGVDRLLSQR